MYIYKPNSVVLPESLKLTRIFPKVSGSESAYRNELDSNTIFYDVFLDRNTRRLRGIGPRLLNLKSQILPLHVLVNGEKVSLRIHQVKKLFFFETGRLSNLLHDSIIVTLHFKNFKKNIKLNWKRDECELEKFDENLLTISALQKDNHFTWIRDWILWHRRLHKVGRVVLYDNGSEEQKILIKQLKSLEPEVQLIFVNWPFPYGIQPYKFAQNGSLNHCRLKFAIPGAYCINLDVDEYLTNLSNDDLVKFLNSKLDSQGACAAHIKELRVPNIADKNRTDVARCFCFPYRYQIFGNRPVNEIKGKRGNSHYMKYIYRFGNNHYNDVHEIRIRNSILNFEKIGVRIIFLYLKKKYLWKILRIIYGDRPEYPKPRIQLLPISESDLFFFHFRGLNTNWKKHSSLEKVEFNNELHVEEPLIATLAKKAGFTR